MLSMVSHLKHNNSQCRQLKPVITVVAVFTVRASCLRGYTDWLFVSGGLHHAAVRIAGEDVYRHLKHEGGTHRVQRIPEVGLSSRMQRIHTGTMTVIILPQPVEVGSAFISLLPALSSSDFKALWSSVHRWTSTLIQRISASTRSDPEAPADKV